MLDHGDRGYADPPVSLSTILGDAVHNYRCALDHLSWRLVVAGGVTLTAQQERDVQFPIYADETKYDNNASTRRLPGVGGGVIAAIKKVLRYPVAKPLPPMHTLQALSNDDKHRAIHLVTAALWKADVDFECTGCRPVGYVAPPTMPILKRGTRLAGMNLIYEMPNPTVTIHIKPIPAVFLEDGREATGVLGDIDDEVRAFLAMLRSGRPYAYSLRQMQSGRRDRSTLARAVLRVAVPSRRQ